MVLNFLQVNWKKKINVVTKRIIRNQSPKFNVGSIKEVTPGNNESVTKKQKNVEKACL